MQHTRFTRLVGVILMGMVEGEDGPYFTDWHVFTIPDDLKPVLMMCRDWSEDRQRLVAEMLVDPVRQEWLRNAEAAFYDHADLTFRQLELLVRALEHLFLKIEISFY